MLLLKSFIIWILFVFLAILNGTSRQKYISPKLGDYSGHVISTVILILVIFVVTFFFVRHLQTDSTKDLLTIGIFWVVLTVLFEFGFGHYVMGHPWSRLLADYNIFKGRLWCLVLLNNLVAPLICGKFL
jgi:hypothetical protein